MGRIFAGILLLAGSVAHGLPAPENTAIDVVYDFIDSFSNERVVEGDASVSSREESGGETLPGLFVHTVGDREARVVYRNVPVPIAPNDKRAILLFRIGFRDGFDWDAPQNPNGAEFVVRVNGDEVFREKLAEHGWRARAIDLAEWSGDEITVEFATASVGGNTSYDWALFGAPIVASYDGVAPPDQKVDAPGCLLVETRGAGAITFQGEGERSRIAVGGGEQLIPVVFEQYDPGLNLAVSGDLQIIEQRVALFSAQLEVIHLDLSTPLIFADVPFNVIAEIENTGLGPVREGRRTLRLEGDNARILGSAASVGALEPGDRGFAVWRGVRANAPGAMSLSIDGPEASLKTIVLTDKLDEAVLLRDQTELSAEDSIMGVVGNDRARVVIVDGGEAEAYGVMQVHNDDAWRRAGSVYPLASWSDVHGRQWPVNVVEVEAAGDGLIIDGHVGPHALPVRVAIEPTGSETRFPMRTELTLPSGESLTGLYGPQVLAGDRSFGAAKDYAIVPGLEFLAGDEPSSNDRDLWPPHSDRRVSAIHEVAGPLMAVQADGLLVAMLWEPKQTWAPDEPYPSARFWAPSIQTGFEHIHMSLFAPSVGEYVDENAYSAETAYVADDDTLVSLESVLVLDAAERYENDSVAHQPGRAGLALQAIDHYFDESGTVLASPMPRTWEEERALSRSAYFDAVWQDEPPGFRHCHGWAAGAFVGHAVPLLLDLRAGVDDAAGAAITRRTNAVIQRMLQESGPENLWSGAGCHIVNGELPFFVGYLPEAFAGYRNHARAVLNSREDGLWRWYAQSEKHATLGTDGTHTLGQAAANAWKVLRAARFTGDPALIQDGLAALDQLALYDVPRGGQMWECPQLQPDILPAAHAIRAYVEAYRLTGDDAYLDNARYWAWTGLPFLYLWGMDTHPTMQYNVIAVMGSTFYSHSWIGLPVVWCGLVYAYALQDLAPLNDDMPWKEIARGITRSAMWQQYTDGPNKGTYPDSWNMVVNEPRPADINPENIMMNAFRLRGHSAEPRFAKIDNGGEGLVVINSLADIDDVTGAPETGDVSLRLSSQTGWPVHTIIAPVPKPASVSGAGAEAGDSAALIDMENGWLYDNALNAIIIKTTFRDGGANIQLKW